VIAADVGAINNVIENGRNGWIVPSNDIEALAAAILEAVENPAQRKLIGEEGKKSLYPKFCPNARAERIIQIYKDVMQREMLQNPLLRSDRPIFDEN